MKTQDKCELCFYIFNSLKQHKKSQKKTFTLRLAISINQNKIYLIKITSKNFCISL